VSCGESEGVLGTFYSNHDRLVEANPAARESVVENLDRNTLIPYHPDAVRDYREIGVALPASLVSAR
jgi:TRAP-type uncharacterized transport system substrate-binding protein